MHLKRLRAGGRCDVRPGPTRPAEGATVHGLLLLGLLALVPLVPPLAAWPARVLVPPTLYLLLVVAVPGWRHTAGSLRAGTSDRRSVGWTVAVILVSTGALVLWHAWARPDLRFFTERFPVTDRAGLIAVGLVFAVGNAAIEELVWRGVLLDALAVRIGVPGALVGQAIGFGIGHSHGIPGGIVGVLLATSYGLMLGGLRHMSGGLALCIGAHVCADAVIFALAFQSV